MKKALILLITSLMVLFCCSVGFAEKPTMQPKKSAADIYYNKHYRFSFVIPSGFLPPIQMDHNSGIILQSKDNKAVIRLYADTIQDGNFSQENNDRLEWDKKAGWKINQQNITQKSALWTGKLNTQLLYHYSTSLCKKNLLSFNIHYDQSLEKTYQPLITEWLKGLNTQKCH